MTSGESVRDAATAGERRAYQYLRPVDPVLSGAAATVLPCR